MRRLRSLSRMLPWTSRSRNRPSTKKAAQAHKKQPILSINMLLKVDDAAVIRVDKAGNVGNDAFLILAGQHQGESSPSQNILLDLGISSFK